MQTRFRRCTTALLAIVLTSSASLGGDVVKPSNLATLDMGVLVDGQRAGVPVNDLTYLPLNSGGFFGALFPSIPLDNFTLAADSNELVAFAWKRPPLLEENIAWSSGKNTVPIAFADEYRIPVQFWVVKGPFEDQSQLVAEAVIETATIWADERQGIGFAELAGDNPIDATGFPAAADFHAFDCNLAGDIVSQIGQTPGMLNVYYVDTVSFFANPNPKTSNGVWCSGPGIVAMGSTTLGHLLTHEIGHAFWLQHVNVSDPPGIKEHFDTSNVMHNASFFRAFLTEGQTFRTVFTAGSAINDVYDVRDGAPIRNCPHSADTADERCPAIQKRLWTDGCCEYDACCDAWDPN